MLFIQTSHHNLKHSTMCFTIMSSLPTLRLRFKNKSTTSILPRVAFVSPLLDLFFLDFFFFLGYVEQRVDVSLSREQIVQCCGAVWWFQILTHTAGFVLPDVESARRNFPEGSGGHVLQSLPLRDAFFLSTQVIWGLCEEGFSPLEGKIINKRRTILFMKSRLWWVERRNMLKYADT